MNTKNTKQLVSIKRTTENFKVLLHLNFADGDSKVLTIDLSDLEDGHVGDKIYGMLGKLLNLSIPEVKELFSSGMFFDGIWYSPVGMSAEYHHIRYEEGSKP